MVRFDPDDGAITDELGELGRELTATRAEVDHIVIRPRGMAVEEPVIEPARPPDMPPWPIPTVDARPTTLA